MSPTVPRLCGSGTYDGSVGTVGTTTGMVCAQRQTNHTENNRMENANDDVLMLENDLARAEIWAFNVAPLANSLAQRKCRIPTEIFRTNDIYQ